MVGAFIFCALLVTAAASVLDMTQDQWRAKCDIPELSWLTTYIRWAKQERSKGIPAAGVKYLVWSCDLPPGKKVNYAYCYGLSDRLRGILMALRMAVASKRLLLVHQTLPAAMQEFLVPHFIDWGVQSTELPAFQERVVFTNNVRACNGGTPSGNSYVWDNYSCSLPAMFANGSIHNVDTQFLFVETNGLLLTPHTPNPAPTSLLPHCCLTPTSQPEKHFTNRSSSRDITVSILPLLALL